MAARAVIPVVPVVGRTFLVRCTEEVLVTQTTGPEAEILLEGAGAESKREGLGMKAADGWWSRPQNRHGH